MATSLSRTLRNVSKYKVFIDHTTDKSTSSKRKEQIVKRNFNFNFDHVPWLQNQSNVMNCIIMQ